MDKKEKYSKINKKNKSYNKNKNINTYNNLNISNKNKEAEEVKLFMMVIKFIL